MVDPKEETKVEQPAEETKYESRTQKIGAFSHHDRLNMNTNPEVQQQLKPGDRVKFSSLCYKYNRWGSKQERMILVSNDKVINCKKTEF